MTIALMNIPFAIVGIAIAIVPLIIGMKCENRTKNHDVTVSSVEAFDIEPRVEEFEHAA
jgi:hypothetical protein